mgnify:FL=1
MTNLEDLEKILNKSGYTLQKKWRDCIPIYNSKNLVVGWIRTKSEEKNQEGIVISYGNITQYNFGIENEGQLKTVENSFNFRRVLEREKIPYRENISKERLDEVLKKYGKTLSDLNKRCKKLIREI